MTGEVVRYSPTPSLQEVQTMERIASNLAKSGMFKDAHQATQAFAKIALGRGLGLDPASSLVSINIVKGKPELSADLQASMLRSFVGKGGERYDYEVERIDNEGCVLNFTRTLPDGKIELLGTSSFTAHDAHLAGLWGKDGPWKNYPRNMLFARAMSNGVAWFCPEVTYGIRVYSDGEIDPSRAHPIPDAPDVPEGAEPAVVAPPPADALPAAPAAPEIEHAGLDDMKALRAAIDGAQIAGDALAALFDGVGIPAGDTPRDRIKLASREQVLAATERAKATAPAASASDQQTIDGTATETSSAPVEGVMGAEAA